MRMIYMYAPTFYSLELSKMYSLNIFNGGGLLDIQ